MPQTMERIVLKEMAATTTTIDTELYPVSIDKYSSITIVINCTTVAGTNPTLDIFFQGCGIPGDPGLGMQTVPQQTAAFTLTYTLIPLQPKMWMRMTIGGTATPTFTYKIIMWGKVL